MGSNRRFLFLVEGEDTEVKLLNRIIKCFPSITLSSDDILVYRTNIWVLCEALKRNIGEEWYKEEIDFLNFLRTSTNVCEQLENFETASVTDIFLIFDYERQDPRFDPEMLENMMDFWSNSTENGLLYINYPMLEAYSHIKNPLPNHSFLESKCNCRVLYRKIKGKNQYKAIAREESDFPDLSAIDKNVFQELAIHHFCKASSMIYKTNDISKSTALEIWKDIDNVRKLVLKTQNEASEDVSSGFVYIIATCLWFICEYDSALIFG